MLKIKVRNQYVLHLPDLTVKGPAVINVPRALLEGQWHKVEILEDKTSSPEIKGLEKGAKDALQNEQHIRALNASEDAFLTSPRRFERQNDRIPYCPQCRNPLPTYRKSLRRYCSPQCRKAAYRKRKSSRPSGGAITIVDALSDKKLFASSFGDLETWAAWITFLKCLFGLPLEGFEAEIFQRHTRRQNHSEEPSKEGWVVVGRRGGKSRISALVAVFLACFRDYSRVLAPGEQGTLMVIAADRRQARTVFRYIVGLIESSPLLARMVRNRTKESIELSNDITIEVHTASFRAVRGYTVVGAILDEVAFWWTAEESANPDTEIVTALRPAMATIPGALLLAISSPYAKRGILWQMYSSHFGKDCDSILVWQAATRDMNPLVPQSIIEEARLEDEASSVAEYGGQFRKDLESYVSRESIEACVVAGSDYLPPVTNVEYAAFCDPSGGSQDSMTLAIAHLEGRDGREIGVLDCIIEKRPPFSPEEVVQEFASVLQNYGILLVYADRYAGAWVTERFMEHGILCDPSTKPKSDLYREFLPLLNSRRVELLDNARLVSQLQSLERRTARGGRDSIDHPPGRHDDVANAAVGALLLAVSREAEAPRVL